MMAAVMGTFLVIILIIVMVLLISCVKIVRQAQALVIERLGAYQASDRGSCCKKSGYERAGCRFCATAGYHKR